MADTEQHYVPHQIYARLPVLADMLNIVVKLRSLIGAIWQYEGIDRLRINAHRGQVTPISLHAQ